jgi:hypothetical protein
MFLKTSAANDSIAIKLQESLEYMLGCEKNYQGDMVRLKMHIGNGDLTAGKLIMCSSHILARLSLNGGCMPICAANHDHVCRQIRRIIRRQSRKTSCSTAGRFS